MSDKDFLSRWSRRKLGGEQAVPEPPPADAPAPAEASPEEEFDPATLPPIESITSATDITAFLRKGVPLELSRAALRRVWVADPAIRDYVGLAENAWDFNDPTAMPGFGPLDQSPEEVRQMVSRMFGEAQQVIEEVAETADKLAPAPEATNSVESVAPEPQQAAVTDENDAPPPAPALQQESAAQNRAVQHDSPPQEGSPRRRSHGGALPT